MEAVDNALIQNSVLIPGLTDDVAIECLIRVPYSCHSEMGFVCKSWKALFSSKSFYGERQRLCFTEHLICLIQPLIPTNRIDVDRSSCADQKHRDDVVKSSYPSSPPSYGLSVYNVSNKTWQRVSCKSAFEQLPVPMFCHCVSLPDLNKLMIVGGWDTQTLEPVSRVYVFDLVTRTLTRGASMKKARSFFACAAVGGSKVYVAGGHDGQKNALKSAEMYDAENDEWTTLPDMEHERDECHGMWWSGDDCKFWVVSGYETECQGRFRRDAECYDPDTNSWSVVDNVWPFATLSPRCTAAVNGVNGKEWHWFLSSKQVQGVELDTYGRSWDVVKSVIRVPEGMSGSNLPCVASSDQVVVMGSSSNRPDQVSCSTSDGNSRAGSCCDGDAAFIYGKNKKWRHIHTPTGFSGFPYSASYLVI